ncbi:MAG: hypothetical protein JW725_04245 [Candidatus Babeliaceae bacterium]|nr:hypothetical protein [Candidatus Babeliaceae bacterium]
MRELLFGENRFYKRKKDVSPEQYKEYLVYDRRQEKLLVVKKKEGIGSFLSWNEQSGLLPTIVIGMGVAALCALVTVNLYQKLVLSNAQKIVMRRAHRGFWLRPFAGRTLIKQH